MTERRTAQRNRSYLGGRIAFNGRTSSMDCLVRNVSPTGAKLAFSAAVSLPDAFDLAIDCKGLTTRARVVWRLGEEMGVAFAEETGTGATEVVSLDHARRLRACERERNALRARLEALTAIE